MGARCSCRILAGCCWKRCIVSSDALTSRHEGNPYHPSPQKASFRPQSPLGPQQAPHVGVHTQLAGVLGPQVPSSVISPVSHAGGVPVVWETTMPENRSPRTTCEAYMMTGRCVVSQNWVS